MHVARNAEAQHARVHVIARIDARIDCVGAKKAELLIERKARDEVVNARVHIEVHVAERQCGTHIARNAAPHEAARQARSRRAHAQQHHHEADAHVGFEVWGAAEVTL